MTKNVFNATTKFVENFKKLMGAILECCIPGYYGATSEAAVKKEVFSLISLFDNITTSSGDVGLSANNNELRSGKSVLNSLFMEAKLDGEFGIKVFDSTSYYMDRYLKNDRYNVPIEYNSRNLSNKISDCVYKYVSGIYGRIIEDIEHDEYKRKYSYLVGTFKDAFERSGFESELKNLTEKYCESSFGDTIYNAVMDVVSKEVSDGYIDCYELSNEVRDVVKNEVINAYGAIAVENSKNFIISSWEMIVSILGLEETVAEDKFDIRDFIEGKAIDTCPKHTEGKSGYISKYTVDSKFGKVTLYRNTYPTTTVTLSFQNSAPVTFKQLSALKAA